jgi:hypothetical protein
MVSCDKIKRDRASVASPAPFEIPARSLSLRFSHRFQRIAKAQLIWYSASPNGLGIIAVNSFMLLEMTDP